jgi:hypothetical protein
MLHYVSGRFCFCLVSPNSYALDVQFDARGPRGQMGRERFSERVQRANLRSLERTRLSKGGSVGPVGGACGRFEPALDGLEAQSRRAALTQCAQQGDADSCLADAGTAAED